jgi:hypothetical protein
MRARWTLLAATLAACRPNVEDAPYAIAAERVLAVRGDPPESPPGRPVTYRALIAPGTSAELDWSFCVEPKPLTENDVVSKDCLAQGSPSLMVLARGAGATITATTPPDACQLFGPDPPPGMYRPRDPDVTGGYYQPLSIFGAGSPAVALERILCNLAKAPIDVAAEYRARYTPNRNPTLLDVAADMPLDRVPPGATVTLSASWSSDSAETYVLYDPATTSIIEAQEVLSVAWFATEGAFETSRTTGDNTWTAPDTEGQIAMWIVLRDSRGGVDFLARTIAVAR